MPTLWNLVISLPTRCHRSGTGIQGKGESGLILEEYAGSSIIIIIIIITVGEVLSVMSDFSTLCEFDIWFFASADGSGEIRARVALRGWNQLLGRGKKERGVGQRGEDVMELSEWTLLLNLLSVRSRTFKHLLSLAVQSRELQPLDYVIYYLHLLYVRCRRHGPGVINLRLKPCPYTPYAVLTQTGVRVWLCHNFVFLSGVLYICTCE